jgi:hypothetical protein
MIPTRAVAVSLNAWATTRVVHVPATANDLAAESSHRGATSSQRDPASARENHGFTGRAHQIDVLERVRSCSRTGSAILPSADPPHRPRPTQATPRTTRKTSPLNAGWPELGF